MTFKGKIEVTKDTGSSVHFELNEHYYSEVIEFFGFSVSVVIHFHRRGGDRIEYWRNEWINVASMASMEFESPSIATNEDRISHVRKRANKLLTIASRVLKVSCEWSWDDVKDRDDNIIKIINGEAE